MENRRLRLENRNKEDSVEITRANERLIGRRRIAQHSTANRVSGFGIGNRQLKLNLWILAHSIKRLTYCHVAPTTIARLRYRCISKKFWDVIVCHIIGQLQILCTYVSKAQPSELTRCSSQWIASMAQRELLGFPILSVKHSFLFNFFFRFISY